MAGAVTLTGMVLTGALQAKTVDAFAEFDVCGQSLRVGGDVKLKGVLVGRINEIERPNRESKCRITLGINPDNVEDVPANIGAQIRAKTVFGEKWVELLLPEDPVDPRINEGDVIPLARTIDPLEVETILNLGMPLLEAIDPEALAGVLEALAEGFSGHEAAAIRGIDQGLLALEPLVRNEGLVEEGIDQLDDSNEVFDDIDEDLLEALDKLDDVNLFTTRNQALIQENLRKAPLLLQELSIVFEDTFQDMTRLVDSGATLIGLLAARSDDLDRLLEVLPKHNNAWIRNLDHVCRHRQAYTEEGGVEITPGKAVPGRCWRVHNILSHSRGPYTKKDKPKPEDSAPPPDSEFERLGVERVTSVSRLLYRPALGSKVAAR